MKVYFLTRLAINFVDIILRKGRFTFYQGSMSSGKDLNLVSWLLTN